MKTYFKYLIIGWSIVSVALVVLFFQITKDSVIEEEYVIQQPELISSKVNEFIKKKRSEDPKSVPTGREMLLNNAPSYGYLEEYLQKVRKTITKEELNAILKDEGLKIKCQRKIDDPAAVYILFPLFAFFIWALPVTVFSLVGLLFSKNSKHKTL